MNGGEIMGWDVGSGQFIRLTWSRGLIDAIEPVPPQKSSGTWLAPSLVDLQINGFAGIDFQRDSVTSTDLIKAVQGLRANGCGRFFLTLMTDDWTRLLARLRQLRAVRHSSELLTRAIIGWHIEGPFLSSERDFFGAHNPAYMRDPAPELIRELRRAAGDDSVLLTLAPERPHALDAISLATQLGMTVCLGHTNASLPVLSQAVKAGAKGFTHLGNGCPRNLDRHDNILWRVLETDGLAITLIPDEVHVSAPLFRLFQRLIKPDSIIYITDAMAAAAAPPGRYTLGPLELEVGADQVVHLPGSPLFAGSALRPIAGVFRAARMLGRPWQELWDCATRNPCRLLGLPELWQPGQPADFCRLDVDRENQCKAGSIYIDGIRSDLDLTL
jgi:N-acetylglucosamine-6-phosphate deacetylase